MSFNGTYNIKLVSGSPTGNSAIYNSSDNGVALTAFNASDDKQKWSIKPVSDRVPNAYTIQSAAKGTYVYGDAPSVWLRDSAYIWFIEKAGDHYRIVTDYSNKELKFWLPNDAGAGVIITANTTWLWDITN